MAPEVTKTRIPLWYNPPALLALILLPIPILVVGVALALFYAEYGMAPLRFLPSDEAMIANFHSHRADFERLVHIYRECPILPIRMGHVFEVTPEIRAIMRRINISGIDNDSRLWLPPDPYSDDVKQRIKSRGLWKKLVRGRLEARQYAGVVLFYDHRTIRKWDSHFTSVYKAYYYTPAIPRIEEGYLLQPERGRLRILPVLCKYPSDVGEEYGCVYRQIELQWFIRMCETP